MLVGGLVIAIRVVLGCCVVGLRCVLVMLCCLLVCVVCHGDPLCETLISYTATLCPLCFNQSQFVLISMQIPRHTTQLPA